jgi:large subunit ribosomal protein L32
MAAEPKKKISKVRSKTRRAHWHPTMPTLNTCPKCKTKKPTHMACPECGYYGDKKVLNTKADKKIAQALKLQAKAEQDKKKAEAKKERIEKVKADKAARQAKKAEAKPSSTKKIIQDPARTGEEYKGDE